MLADAAFGYGHMKSKSTHSKVVAIIQARMGSTRLPGKVLTEIHGHPMLWHVVRRTRAAKTLDQVIVATTTEPADDAIVAFCSEHGVVFFRGSEMDVLDRYYQAARQHDAHIIVRITADCPLIDPEIIDKTVRAFLSENPDYASNSIVRCYPRGLDTEVISLQALQSAWHEARKGYQRTHVTPYIYEDPGRFRTLSVSGDEDWSAYRWTVDTPEDLEFVRAIYSRGEGKNFLLSDVLQLIQREPELAEINRSVAQKALHES
ncbi:MAG: glycosyltransferase family protein [Candidatus Sulfotelmatobacter sp.]